MKKIFLLTIFILLFLPCTHAEYVSPETYAVNESELVDYINIPAPKRLDITNPNKKNSSKAKRITTEKKNKKPLESRLSYKFAKWWVDQRYKREEVHHGTKHEIKVNSEYRRQKQNTEEI